MNKRRNRYTVCLLSLALVTMCSIAHAQPAATRVSGCDYRRPTFAPGSRLLFIGDSITDMKWGRNEKDRNHYLGHSFVFLIASRLQTDLADAKLEFFNRGKSGNTVGDLKDRWQRDAIDMKPDVLTILIGVNDVGRACRADKQVDLKAVGSRLSPHPVGQPRGEPRAKNSFARSVRPSRHATG